MFSFVKEKQALTALDVTSSNVLKRIGCLMPVERAQVLAVANSFMIAGAGVYGRDFAFSPMSISKEVAISAVLEFAERLKSIEASADQVNGLSADDPKMAAFKRELSACEVAMVTAGASFHEPSRKAAIASWRSLGKARPFAKEAVKVLLLYIKTHSLDPVVRINGKAADAKSLFSLASTLPPMIRPKAKTKK